MILTTEAAMTDVDGTIDRVLWTFGDGTSMEIPANELDAFGTISHFYPGTGTYSAKGLSFAVVVDSFDCSFEMLSSDGDVPSYITGYHMNNIRRPVPGLDDVWEGFNDIQTTVAIPNSNAQLKSHYVFLYYLKFITKSDGAVTALQCDCHTMDYRWGSVGLSIDCEPEPICFGASQQHWYEIPVQNGKPVVSTKNMTPSVQQDEFTFNSFCKYLGASD